MRNILTITTNPSIDRTVWVDKVVPEKKLRANKTEVEPGGGGINVARAIKAMNGNATAFYAQGGYTGLYFSEILQIENFPTVAININEPTRENTLLIDQSTLLEYRIGMQGPTLTAKEQEHFLQILLLQDNFNYWVLSGSLNPNTSVDFYKKIADLASQKQVNLIVDTSGVALQELIKLSLFMVKPNLGELSVICGKPLTNTQAIIEVAQQLTVKNNIKHMVVSLGKEGALMLCENKVYKATPPSVTVKSTVGAGDCMVAGITYAFSLGANAKQALIQGIACGTAATLHSGYGLCKQEDIDRLLKEVVVEEL
jgi:6-phosphofructokinase 2